MSGAAEYRWDVFLSHATADKPLVRRIASRLRDHGLRVWFDEDTIQDGENILGEIEVGLQQSRVLVFFASQASLGSAFASLERRTALFRDPANKSRRFVPVRIDTTVLPDLLRAVKYIEWNELDEEPGFARLISACSLAQTPPGGAITYHQVFTPGVPPQFPELLVGRADALKQLINFLKSPGIHPIVIGDRGIGKTSLVKAAIDMIGYQKRSVLEVNTASSFDDCCRTICADLGIPAPQAQFTPAIFLRTLKAVTGNAIVSIDELDDVPEDSEIRRSFGVFAKAASNHAHELAVKFVFSGIGKEAHSLFDQHISSARNFPQIALRPIRTPDLVAFLDAAFELLKIQAPPRLRETIAHEADGFPYYVHQVGFHTAAAYLDDEDAEYVSDVHLDEGRRRALDAAFSHYLRRYKYTMYQLTELQRALLGELIGSERRHTLIEDIGTRAMLRAGADRGAVKAALADLRDKHYVDIRRGDKTVAFRDALVRPFLRARLGLTPSKAKGRKKPSTGADAPELDLFASPLPEKEIRHE